MLTVIVVTRNEPFLEFTVRRIFETTKLQTEVIIIDDASDTPVLNSFDGDVKIIRNSTSMGVDYSRDLGIVSAKYETCFIIDAHMNFHNDFWSNKIVSYSLLNPTHTACTKCVGLSENNMDMNKPEGIYWGAHIIPDIYDKAGNRFRVLGNKWNAQQNIGEIGSVLGANYVLSKNHYINTLNRPWRYLKGWGNSEQMLSLANFLVGGKNTVIDVEVGHMFRTGPVPYSVAMWKLIYNQLFMLYTLIDDDIQHEMLKWIERNGAAYQQAMSELDWDAISQYKSLIEPHMVYNWKDYQTEWMNSAVAY